MVINSYTVYNMDWSYPYITDYTCFVFESDAFLQ